jgi:hypothetical protein
MGAQSRAGVIDFVLGKDQVAELAAYMQHCVYLLDPPGRKRKQNGLSFVAMNTPKQRLFQELESAAKKAHPTYREIEVDEGMFEIEGEPKEGLVAWFKKNRPKQAARIERAFTKRLWAGKR